MASPVCILPMVLSLYLAVLLSSAGAESQCFFSSNTKCKCCQVISFNHKLREVQINDTVCVKIRSLKAKKGFRFAVIWNKKNLISHRLTTDKVPPFCFATPYIHYLDVCLQFKGLQIKNTHIKGCLQFEIDSGASSKVFPSGCFQIQRKDVASNETEGNVFTLLRSTKTKQISLRNSVRFKDLRNAMNQTNLAIWMKNANNTSKLKKLFGRKFLVGKTPAGDSHTPTLSTSNCWCRDKLFVVCECCVPIKNLDIQHRGCVKLAHIPYSKEINLSFILDGKLSIKENLPSIITKRLCAHQKITNDLKVGACIKPLPQPRRRNKNGLCIDIDARKPHLRFRHRVGCVILAV